MTKPELMVLYSSPEAASIKTVTGWFARTGQFWGDDEHMARYCGSTHKVCDCGEIIEQRSSCQKCARTRSVAKYAGMERRPWDGDAMLFSEETDEYFRDMSEAEDHAFDNGMTLAELRLIICEPTYAREIDGNDHFCDDLPEDGELPAEISNAFDALNEAIRKCTTPLSWSPGEYALALPEDQTTPATPGRIHERCYVMACEYVRDHYGVPAELGRGVTVYGKPGVIAADRGHYIGVVFDGDKRHQVCNCHPTASVEYGELRAIPAMTRSQKNYSEFLQADWFQGTFAEWIGARKVTS